MFRDNVPLQCSASMFHCDVPLRCSCALPAVFRIRLLVHERRECGVDHCLRGVACSRNREKAQDRRRRQRSGTREKHQKENTGVEHRSGTPERYTTAEHRCGTANGTPQHRLVSLLAITGKRNPSSGVACTCRNKPLLVRTCFRCLATSSCECHVPFKEPSKTSNVYVAAATFEAMVIRIIVLSVCGAGTST